MEGKKAPRVVVLDYGAGNVRSLVNALSVSVPGLDFTVESTPEAVRAADVLVFPGVGAFAHAMTFLNDSGCGEALREHIAAGKPYLGVCIGMQVLFDSSTETHAQPSAEPGAVAQPTRGLGIIRGSVTKLDAVVPMRTVPHMGWNTAALAAEVPGEAPAGQGAAFSARDTLAALAGRCVYFVHSFAVRVDDCDPAWVAATTMHGQAPAAGAGAGADAGAGAGDADAGPAPRFVSAVARGTVVASQFHPEKSGAAGLDFIRAFVLAATGARAAGDGDAGSATAAAATAAAAAPAEGLTKRIVACLDVRANDAGDLVVTKGDQYDVRESTEGGGGGGGGGDVRNMGKPVELASRYAAQGADEVTFLNITSFRDCPVSDLPMLGVLQQTSSTVFVPLTVGGGIRDTAQATALEIASVYFRAGADKVSIGSDAVRAAAKLGYVCGEVFFSFSVDFFSFSFFPACVSVCVFCVFVHWS
jgi:glutamine amidotransferase/cyclase